MEETTNLNWWVDPGFQNHQQLDVGLEVIAWDIGVGLQKGLEPENKFE